MKIVEITEDDNVLQFPNTGSTLDVPPGYEKFYIKPTSSGKSAHIMGITPKGIHKQVSTVSDISAAQKLVDAYNNGGKTQHDIKPISWIQAFGSPIEKELDNMGIKQSEKPESWNQIKKQSTMSFSQLQQLKHVENIPNMDEYDFFIGGRHDPTSDSSLNTPKTIIVNMKNGDKFLATRGGMSRYHRFWTYIRPNKLELVR